VNQGMITPGDAETGDLLHSHAQHIADFLARRVGGMERTELDELGTGAV
jgi:hypothetical protein